MLREIAGPAGRLEALLEEPGDRRVTADGLLASGRVRGNGSGVRAAVVFAHPHPQHGGTMHTKVVFQGAKALQRIGCAVLRFNFRGIGRSEGAWDGGRGEVDDFRAAVAFMEERYPGARLWAAGMSFGAWIAMSAGAANPRIDALIGIATPVSNYDFTAVGRSAKAKFLIHGERDVLFPLHEVREFYAQAAEPKELVVIDAADHLFDGKVGDVADALEELLGDY